MNTRWIGAAIGGAAIGLLAVGTALVVGNHTSPTTTSAAPQVTTTVNRTITVSGEGTVTVKPDTATVSMGVQATASTATAALAQANDSAIQLIAALKAAGVANDDIVTTGIQVYPTYSSANVINGYQASNSVSATVRSIDRTGPVIDAAAAAAGDRVTIGGVSFSVGDPEKVIGTARAAAIANASARAGQFAAAAHVQVGAVLQISEVSVSPVPVFSMDKAAAPSSGGTPVQTGTQDLSVSVTVVYELT